MRAERCLDYARHERKFKRLHCQNPLDALPSLRPVAAMAGSHNQLERRGLLFVLSSPSGAGKSTLSRMLLEAEPQIALSVSYTTRPPRPGGGDGVPYHFTHLPAFQGMAANREIL